MKITSIAFDFDGTLAELHLDFAEMKLRLNELARSHIRLVPPEPFLPVLEWVVWLEGKMGGPNGVRARDFREKAHALIREMEMEAARKGALFAFTRPLLLELWKRNIKTAIITRNCEAAVRTVFPDISNYCRVFLARDHVPIPKPDPAHLACALQAIGADAGSSLMVGDHPIDIQTGKAVGARTAGVFSGKATRAELLGSGPDWVAADCEELIAALDESGILAASCI